MIQLFSMHVTELLTKVDQTQRENMALCQMLW